MPEDVFWRTMNPARLHALFDSHFAPLQQQEQPRKPEKGGSLSEFLKEGGLI
jgi:hypothetical protein